MQADINQIIIDAGVTNIHVKIIKNFKNKNIVISNNGEIKNILEKHNLLDDLKNSKHLYITGKLAEIVQKNLGYGETILPAAAFWTEAKFIIKQNTTIWMCG